MFKLRIILLLFLLFQRLARGQIMPDCYFQGVNLVPCLNTGGANISEACCRSLNQALDAGHRCFCSVVLSNNLLASLSTISTLPFVLPLPGCYLYAPSLAACQVALQTNAAAAAAATARMEPAVLPAPPQAAVTPSSRPTTGAQDGPTVSRTRIEAKDGVQLPSSSSALRQFKIDGGTSMILAMLVVIYAWTM